MRPQLILAASLLALLIMIGLWDIWALLTNRSRDTVSEILSTWSQNFPIIPLIVGIILGHLFWPRAYPFEPVDRLL